MIHQWEHSIKECEFVCKMSYTARFVKPRVLFEYDEIKMKHLIELSSSFCRLFLHYSMHLEHSTRLAINRFRCWPLWDLNIIDLFQLINDVRSTVIETKMSKSRSCFSHSDFARVNEICLFIQHLIYRIEFQQQNIEMHAYFAYFLIRFYMHKNISMKITIVVFLDETCERDQR